MLMRTFGIAVLVMLLVFGLIGLGNWVVGSEQVHETSEIIDSFEGVFVYYNGRLGEDHGRHKTDDGYNLGFRWQGPEFVKRYYLEVYDHKMPDPYGRAVDFYDPKLDNGEINNARGLRQFSNPGYTPPRPGDLLVIAPSSGRPYGQVGIVTHIANGQVEYIQQNPGPKASTRSSFDLNNKMGQFTVGKPGQVLGWLRMP